MSIIKNFKELFFLCFSILIIIIALCFLGVQPIKTLLNPERFECSRLKNECFVINSRQDRIFDLSKIRSAKCQKTYHPGIRTAHTETWLCVETNNSTLEYEKIYRTGFCENQVKKLNGYLNSVDEDFEIKQVIDNYQISIAFYLLLIILFIGGFLKKIFVEIIKFLKSK